MATVERLVLFGPGFIGIALIVVSMFLPLWDAGSVAFGCGAAGG